MEIGERLRKVILENYKTMSAFRREIGMDNGSLIRNLKNKPSLPLLIAAKKQIPNLNLNWLLTGEGIPYLDENDWSKKVAILEEATNERKFLVRQIGMLQDLVDRLKEDLEEKKKGMN